MDKKFAAKLFMYFLNVFAFVLALTVLGLAVKTANNLEGFSGVDFSSLLLFPIYFAIIVLLVSLFGIWGVYYHNKCVLCIYLIPALIATLVVIIVGAALLVAANEIDEATETNLVENPGSVATDLTDFGLSVYQICCPGGGSFVGVCPGCDDANFCDGGAGIVTRCVSDTDEFNDLTTGIDDSAAEFCEFLEDNVEINGHPMIGDARGGGNSQSCGGGTGEGFIGDIIDFFTGNIRPLGAVFVTMAVALFVNSFCTCVLLCVEKKTDVVYLDSNGNEITKEQAEKNMAPTTPFVVDAAPVAVTTGDMKY